jgi:hypothetical protein
VTAWWWSRPALQTLATTHHQTSKGYAKSKIASLLDRETIQAGSCSYTSFVLNKRRITALLQTNHRSKKPGHPRELYRQVFPWQASGSNQTPSIALPRN